VGWENRERGGPYYTRSRREGGRVVREFVGGGLAGRLASEADRIRRERREAEDRRRRRELELLQNLSAPLGELSEAAEVLARAELVAGGYHKHKGEWRRGRTHPGNT
jgi:hypothetical protein